MVFRFDNAIFEPDLEPAFGIVFVSVKDADDLAAAQEQIAAILPRAPGHSTSDRA